MQANADEQVLRLFMLVHKVCLPVVRDYFDKVILASDKYNNDFKTFLRTHKHEIYHMMFPERCCQCITSQRTNCGNHRLFQKQFTKMYKEGCTEAGHVKYQRGKICEHCSCRFVENENCCMNDLDLSVFHALLTRCVPNMPPSHKMWLDKIIKERHKLCHMSSPFTKEQSQAMWDYLDGSVLGLSTDIPPIPSYKDKISTKIELLNDIDFGIDTVKPIMNTMIQEVSEMNNNMNGIIQNQELMQAQVAEVHEKVTTSTSEIISRLDEIKRTLTHRNGNIKCDVEYSAEAPVTDDSKKQIYVKYSITSPSLTDPEMKDVKRSLQKAAASVELWKPYTIVCVEDGSVIIGALLPVDVFENKERFENSIRKFLDQFTDVSGLSNKHDIEIKVSIVVSSAVSRRPSFHDKNIQVQTETSEKEASTDNTIFSTDNRRLDVSFRFRNMNYKRCNPMSDAEEETLNEIIKIVNKPRWFSPLESITTVGKRHTPDPLKCVINVIGGDYLYIDRHSDINVLLSVPDKYEMCNSFRSLTQDRTGYHREIHGLKYTDSLILCIGCRHSWMSQLEAAIRKKFPSFASQDDYKNDFENGEECSRCKEDRRPLYLRPSRHLLHYHRGFLLASTGMDASQLLKVAIQIEDSLPWTGKRFGEIIAVLVSKHMTQSTYNEIIKDKIVDVQIIINNEKLNVNLDERIHTEHCKDALESVRAILNIPEKDEKGRNIRRAIISSDREVSDMNSSLPQSKTATHVLYTSWSSSDDKSGRPTFSFRSRKNLSLKADATMETGKRKSETRNEEPASSRSRKDLSLKADSTMETKKRKSETRNEEPTSSFRSREDLSLKADSTMETKKRKSETRNEEPTSNFWSSKDLFLKADSTMETGKRISETRNEEFFENYMKPYSKLKSSKLDEEEKHSSFKTIPLPDESQTE